MTEKLDDNIQEFCYSQQESVMEQISLIPNYYKEIILLYYLCEYSVKEITKILHLRESAVKMRLYRARKYLQINMED